MTTKDVSPKPPDEDQRFAISTKLRREASKWTRKDLAELVDVSAQTIYEIEAGRRGVSRRVAVAIARAFGTTVEEMSAPVSPAAVRVQLLVEEVGRIIETGIGDQLAAAQDKINEIRDDLATATREIEELPVGEPGPEVTLAALHSRPRLTPEQIAHANREATEQFYAMALGDAVYLVEQFPAFLDAMWALVQDFVNGGDPERPVSWSVALGQVLARAAALGSTEGK
ncbi:MAG: helix-turn-helix transcriptional regulator [Protaetiibacter sp.]